jgi:hypothetical protein
LAANLRSSSPLTLRVYSNNPSQSPDHAIKSISTKAIRVVEDGIRDPNPLADEATVKRLLA